MLRQLRNRNFYIMIGGDLFLFCLSLFSAYLIRFDFSLSRSDIRQILHLLPIVLPIKSIIFFLFGLYRGMWRYSGIRDMLKLFQASFFSSLCVVTVILYFYHFKGYSRGVFLIDGVLTFLFTGGFRLSVRLLYSRGLIYRTEKREHIKKKPTVIVGAGDAGEMTIREIIRNPFSRYRPVAFVDDDPKKIGRSIHGVKVEGTVDDLPKVVERFGAEQILIAIPSATGKQMRRIIDICERCSVPYKTLPSLSDLIDGKVSIKDIRDIKYEDLLRRPPVRIRSEEISRYISGKRILITGAGGSIGSELCRQIVRFNPEKMILFDTSESNLYEIHTELEYRFGYKRYEPILGNVQYRPVIEKVVERYRPHVIVHAAAYKHVPMMELHPWEAVFNNILGSRNVMQAAVKYGAERFIMVSTDKAVRPANVMGASKRVCELIMLCLNGEGGTKMMCVRFGNVIGSAGSVVPLFKKQIEYGGPVTVTHPEVTRYFMTIQEACLLILQAGAMGKGGEVFILDMGEPVRIIDIARDLIRLSGKEVDIIFTGLRPGEKLYEELIQEGEKVLRTEHEKILVLKNDNSWFGYGSRERFKEWLDLEIEKLKEAAKEHDPYLIRKILKEIVPEYSPECFLSKS